MSLAMMKSPARQGCTSITSYRCEDCGDVSHSQASLSLHRSVCQSSSKSHDLSDSEMLEKNSDVTAAKTEQIAESCECPKCGEHLLLLRQHNFNCALCEFQDTDQARFFTHLKGHYEHSAVLTVDPGSVIIEQVIDDMSDLDNGNNFRDEPDHNEPDDHDDPEYVPDIDNDNDNNDDDDDDDDEEDLETSKSKKPKLGISWKSSPKKGDARKKLDYVKPTADTKLNDTKTEKSKIGISWHTPQEKGASKKLSFVKAPVTPRKTQTDDGPISWTPLKEHSAPKKLSFEKKPSAPRKAVTIKKEPGLSVESDRAKVSNHGISTKWVRLEDIKYIGTPMDGLSHGQSPKYAHAPGLRKPPSPTKLSSTSKGPNQEETLKALLGTSPTKGAGPTENASTEKETKKKAKKSKEKKPKIPREPKIPVCGVCKRVFATTQSLKMHLRIHTGEKNYTCEQCGKAFTQWSTCQQHIVSIHSGIKKYTCEYCGSCFARSTGLAHHRRMHTGEVLHHCNVCGKGFRAKSYLDRHRTLHTGEKRYKCEFCYKTFRTSTDMKRHRNSVHFGLGNVSLTQAKELLLTKMDGLRTPQRPSNTVVQRFVNDNSSSSDDSEEVFRATTVITGSQYEL